MDCKGGEYLAQTTLLSITGPKATPQLNCYYRIRVFFYYLIFIIKFLGK